MILSYESINNNLKGGFHMKFSKNMDSRTLKLARDHGIKIYVISRDDINKYPKTRERAGEKLTLAWCYIRSKEVFLVKEDFLGYTLFALDFVLLHELGHIICNTQDECRADEFAVGVLAKRHGEKEALKIYKNALLSMYKFNPKTNMFMAGIPTGEYSHRQKWLLRAAKGL